MSQSQKDTQALLQSMLQRLKLQPGKEGQAYLHTPGPASTWGPGGEPGASDLQNSRPVNGFDFGTNGVPSKEFGISAADGNFGLKGGEIQQPGLISFPSQKDNIDGDTGEDRVLGQPGITATGTGRQFPAQSRKDADIASFERTDGVSFGRNIRSGNDGHTSAGQNQQQEQDPNFTPKVYAWALKPADANVDSHVGNGRFGAQSKDVQTVPTNSSARRKQRASENKTRRWTQKIKERWRDRPGSFGKKGKEEGRRVEQKSEQGTEISPQNQLLTAENLTSTSNEEEERTSLDSGDPTPTTRAEDDANEGYMRSTGDFEFGLGSFSLLEEIVTGQEWAKFLNPNQSAATAAATAAVSANQRPPELKIPPNLHDSGQSSVMLNQHGGVNNQWSFRRTEPSPDLDVSMAQISPDAFQPVSMDVSEGKPAAVRDVHSEADQSEPMEHGNIRRPLSFVQPADTLDNSALKSRVYLNRKRQHQSAERTDERLHTEKIKDGKETDRERSMSSPSLTSNHAMDETGDSQRDDLVPLYVLKSPPPPLSPFTPFAPSIRGVLKHSISQDSQCSMETVSKRRRVEENRRVHFSEVVVTIPPPELDPNATDSEEEEEEEDDSGAEEDSVTEQEYEEQRAAMEQVAPAAAAAAAAARRPALPAWILSLKRRNNGRKHT